MGTRNDCFPLPFCIRLATFVRPQLATGNSNDLSYQEPQVNVHLSYIVEVPFCLLVIRGLFTLCFGIVSDSSSSITCNQDDA